MDDIDFHVSLRWEGDPEKNDPYVIAMDAITRYFRFFDRNRIWLPTEICGPLDKFAEQIRKPTVELGVYLSIQNPTDDTLKERLNVWHKAWNSVQDDIPELRREIEERFRSVLDADSKTNRYHFFYRRGLASSWNCNSG